MSDATGAEGRSTRVWNALVGVDTKWYLLAFYVFLLVWIGWLLVTAWEWSWRDKLVPFIAGVPTFVLLVAKLVKVSSPATYERLAPSLTFVGEDEAPDREAAAFEAALEETHGDEQDTEELEEAFEVARGSDDVTRPPREQFAYAVRMVAWALALPLLMYVIGFANALVLFVLAFGLRFYDRPRDAVIVTVVFSVFMYVFFYSIIGMQPWTGTLEIPSIVELAGLD